MDYSLKASPDEIKALQVILHRACQHSGLEVAEAAAVWNRKLMDAMGRAGNGKLCAGQEIQPRTS